MLLDVFPVPQPVDIAGVRLWVAPMKLRTLAVLDGFIRDRMPLAIEPPAEGLTPWQTRRHWARQFKRSRKWPPRWGSPESLDIVDSVAGRAFFLATVAGLDAAEAVRIANLATDAEMLAVSTAANGSHPSEWLVGLMDPDRPLSRENPGSRITIEEAIDEVSAERGWTYEQIGEMTINQFTMARSGGKVRDMRLIPMPGETVREAAIKRKRLLADGTDGPEPAEDGSNG